MSFGTAFTTLRLLHNFNSRSRDGFGGVRESTLALEGERFPATLFEPSRRPRRTIVLVHGVTGRANADPLIVHLARSLAVLGYRSVVPGLRELAQFAHDPRDIDTIVAAIDASYRLEQHPIPLLAFSYGASYALAAAANSRVRDACAALLGFGAYYDLDEALAHQCELLRGNAGIENDDADTAYLRYTLLACYRDELRLSAEAWAAIEPILVNYTDRAPLRERLEPLLRYASDVDYLALLESYRRRPHSPLLSPANTLRDVRCRVGLLHDPNDRFVPAHHVRRIREVLDARPHAQRTDVLTTPMLSHVQVDPLRRLVDLPKLVRLLEPVLGSM